MMTVGIGGVLATVVAGLVGYATGGLELWSEPAAPPAQCKPCIVRIDSYPVACPHDGHVEHLVWSDTKRVAHLICTCGEVM
jgi:hypothetical protein